MGATNSTPNYTLSQFVGTDKPAWLQDYNGDMLKIDTAIKQAKTAADTAQTTADNANTAVGVNTNDITALQTTVSGLTSSVTSLNGDVNTIESLIGNGTPTTTDQTIIGAINEINAKINGFNILATVTSDGVKTHGQLLNELFAQLQPKIATLTAKQKSELKFIEQLPTSLIFAQCNYIDNTKAEFYMCNYNSILIRQIMASGSTWVRQYATNGSTQDTTATVATAGEIYSIGI